MADAPALASPAGSPLPATAPVRVPSEEAEDMGLFLDNIRADLGSARASCEIVARLFPAWAPAMLRLTVGIAALEGETACHLALARAGLAPGKPTAETP